MAKKAEEPGLQRSAGLVRNFDVDDEKNLRIHPGWVIAAPFIIAAVIALIAIVVNVLS